MEAFSEPPNALQTLFLLIFWSRLFSTGEELEPQISVLLRPLPSHKDLFEEIISAKKPNKPDEFGIIQINGQCGWTLRNKKLKNKKEIETERFRREGSDQNT